MELTKGNNYDWNQVQFTIAGEPINGIKAISYDNTEFDPTKYEYYFKRKNIYFFRNKFGGCIRIESNDLSLSNVLKKGDKYCITLTSHEVKPKES